MYPQSVLASTSTRASVRISSHHLRPPQEDGQVKNRLPSGVGSGHASKSGMLQENCANFCPPPCHGCMKGCARFPAEVNAQAKDFGHVHVCESISTPKRRMVQQVFAGFCLAHFRRVDFRVCGNIGALIIRLRIWAII